MTLPAESPLRFQCPLSPPTIFNGFCTITSCVHHASRAAATSPFHADSSQCLQPFTNALEGDESLTGDHFAVSTRELRKRVTALRNGILAARFLEHITGESAFDATDRQYATALNAESAWNAWHLASGSFTDLQTNLRRLHLAVSSAQENSGT
jgi:hypothetical protein